MTVVDRIHLPDLDPAARRAFDPPALPNYYGGLRVNYGQNQDVADTLKIAGRHVSVDAPFAQGDDNRLLDVLQNDGHMPDHSLNRDSLTLEVERSLSVLAPREADVIRSYFGIGMDNPLTLEEIGEKFKLTRERVRQIKEKAIRRRRQSACNKVLKEYIGS